MTLAPAEDLVLVSTTVNGRKVRKAVAPRLNLVDFLRHELGLTGSHVGCEHGVCGACTVVLDGRIARGCLLFAVQANGRDVETIEGDELEQVFHGGVQGGENVTPLTRVRHTTPSGSHLLPLPRIASGLALHGATAGHEPKVNLRRVFAMQSEILGSSMGTPGELAELLRLLRETVVRPVVDSVFGFGEVREAFARLHSGDVFGKVVLDHTR